LLLNLFMKYLSLCLLLILFSCGGKLSDEQRKKLKENMENEEIVRLTDAEVTEAAFAYGRKVAKQIEMKSSTFSNKRLTDSIAKLYDVKIVTLQNGDSTLMKMEQQLIEAYTSVDGTQLSDNIQRLGQDSLLYTKPIMRERPDGSQEFVKAIGIHLSKKTVVLSLKEK